MELGVIWFGAEGAGLTLYRTSPDEVLTRIRRTLPAPLIILSEVKDELAGLKRQLPFAIRYKLPTRESGAMPVYIKSG